MITGILRHIIQVGAGATGAKGLINGDEMEALTGAIVTIVTIGWYIWERYRAKNK